MLCSLNIFEVFLARAKYNNINEVFRKRSDVRKENPSRSNEFKSHKYFRMNNAY